MDLSLLQDFIAETGENLEEMETALLQLEADSGNREVLNDIFRSAHTIKGSAEYMGMEKIAQLSHKLENLLDILRHGQRSTDKTIIETLIASRDRIAQLVHDLQTTGTESTPIGDLTEKIDRVAGGRSQVQAEPDILEPADESESMQDTPGDEVQDSESETEPDSTRESDTYEEDYDDELFNIFIDHLKENILLIKEKTQAIERTSDTAEQISLLDDCRSYVSRLRSSANYMDYKKLTRNYDEFDARIEKVQGLLSEKKPVAFLTPGGRVTDNVSEGMTEYMKAIVSRFPHLKGILSQQDGLAETSEKPDRKTGSAGKPEKAEDEILSSIERLEAEEGGIDIEEETEKAVDNILASDDQAQDTETDQLHEDAFEIPDLGGLDDLENLDFSDIDSEAMQEESQTVETPAVDYQGLFDELDDTFDYAKTLPEPAPPEPESDPFIDGIEEQLSTAGQDLGDETSREPLEAPAKDEISHTQLPEKPVLVKKPAQALPSDENIKKKLPEKAHEPDSRLKKPASDQPATVAEHAVEVHEADPLARLESEKIVKQTLRVDAQKIDSLMNQVGELVVSRAWFSQLYNEMRELQNYLKDEIRLDQRTMKPVKALTFRISEATMALGRVANELQEAVMKVRMLPIAQLFNRYPRLVRDLIHGTDKKVTLDIRGEETELDKMVIEEISDPLIHIIRNAVDHGCEPAGVRSKSGKPETCTLVLESYHESNHVVIEISDDGRGIDPERIKEKALEMNLYSQDELERMGRRELIELIMKPGFSTAREISTTSGRGVGMDVVKKNVEALNGTIEIDSQVGKGTQIRIKIPLTLAIIQALLVKVGNDIFTIPLAAVEETLRIFENEITIMEGIEVVHLRESTLSLLRLSDIFSIASGMNQRDRELGKAFVVVVNTGMRRVGLVVDELIGQEETVIKPLVDYLQESSGFSGATILGDGRISLILDVYELVNLFIGSQIRKKSESERLRRKKRNSGVESVFME